jgi:phosphoglycolate phosphatase-like HAD superfamily hydrolase
MRSSRSIWFDLDGTLIDVKMRFTSVHRRACELISIHPLADDLYWRFRQEGWSTKSILAYVGSASATQDYYRVRNELIESDVMLELDRLRPGCLTVLTELSRSWTMHLLTGRLDEARLHDQLEDLGISRFFDSVVLVPPFGDWKDKFQVLQANRAGRDVVAGDTERDILAGKAMGHTTIAVLEGMSTRERLEACGPDHIVADLPELARVMGVGTEEGR